MAVAEIRRADPTITQAPASETRLRTDDLVIDVVYVARYWKRIKNVASRYELELAIDRLLDRGLVAIVEGKLSPGRAIRRKFEPVPAEERWRREDAELRAFCEQMSVHETRSSRARDEMELLVGRSNFEESVLRDPPRRGVIRYVLREFQVGDRERARAPMVAVARETLIYTILEYGGWEFVSEEPKRASRKKARRG